MAQLTTPTQIRAARPDESAAISSLAFRSKSHWGYSSEQMEVFRGELTLTPEQVLADLAHIYEQDGTVVGFYTLASTSKSEIELEHIFVSPDTFKVGIGRQLFEHACDMARTFGFTTLVIQSDPNAAGFYVALGATLERQIPSSIPGRTLPCFHFKL